MNVYDFDNTIYNGDSTLDFYFFCLKRNWHLIKYFPGQLLALFLYKLGRINKNEFKERFYIFLRGIFDIDKEVEVFWLKNKYKIKSWYLENKGNDDLIISASPEFLLKPLEKILGIKIIGSLVDKNSGKLISSNCFGIEKIRRYKEKFEDIQINRFYSDSFSDEPMALFSKESFLVKGNIVMPWNEGKKKKQLLNSKFIRFILVGIVNMFNGVLFSYIMSCFIKNVTISFWLGYSLSLIISYILNSKIVFVEKLDVEKAVKFMISYIPNFLIQNLFVLVLYEWFNINKLFTYMMSAMIAVPLTFFILEFFAFKKN